MRFDHSAHPARSLAVCCLLIALLSACALSAPQAAEDSTAALESAHDAGYAAGYDAGFADGQKSIRPEVEKLPAPGSPMDSSGFVSIPEVIPDAILEIRYYSTYNFVGDRIDGYEAPTALLTREAADALQAVSAELSEHGYRLKIYDAYRPQCAVDHFKSWAQDLEDQRMKPWFYPQVEKSQLFDAGYISSRSGHSRGSTVDLTLFDMATGKEADMGGVFDYFGTRSHADYQEDLTEEQLANRQLLRDTMLAHGFKGISTEWWHFTLRDEPYPDTYFNFPVTEHVGSPAQ